MTGSLKPKILGSQVFLKYDINTLGKTAVMSARAQFTRNNPTGKFYENFRNNEQALCEYCIDAFLNDEHNKSALNLMKEAIAQAEYDLFAAIVIYYNS